MALFQSPQQELPPQLLQQLPPQLVPAPKFAFKRREILPLKAKVSNVSHDECQVVCSQN